MTASRVAAGLAITVPHRRSVDRIVVQAADANELRVLGGTPFLMTPYRYQKIAKSLILNAVPYVERARTCEGADCRRGHTDGLRSAAA